jgi:hypothetical protein
MGEIEKDDRHDNKPTQTPAAFSDRIRKKPGERKMPSFEFKTINTFYDDDIARYLITEKKQKRKYKYTQFIKIGIDK